MAKKSSPGGQLDLFSEKIDSPTSVEFKEKLLRDFIAQKGKYLVAAAKKKKRSRANSIFLPEDERLYQDTLAVNTNVLPYPPGCFPTLQAPSELGVFEILTEAMSAPPGADRWVGLDFEFNPDTHKLSIVGVATRQRAAACRWKDELALLLYRATDAGVKFVGHWVIGADKYELEITASRLDRNVFNDIYSRPNGCLTSKDSWVDSMGLHFLCAAALCKAPGKELDDEGSLGFMGLGSATGLWTMLPAGYKHCRGTGCTGPCPRCRVFEYCAIDAWAGLEIAYGCRTFMGDKEIPWSLYERWATLTEDICLRAERRGILVDKPFIDNFETESVKKKENLFPKKGRAYEHFNPKSGSQVVEFFESRGIQLRDGRGKPGSEKKIVVAALEHELRKYGYDDIGEFEKSEDQILLSEVDDLLYKLYLYKDSGKGLDPWFSDKTMKFHDGAWYIHPRFVTTGASTGRLSSSRPNFQNISSRGWGAEVKKAIIPRPGCIICSNDARNLELRIMLYYAGFDTRRVPEDAWTWLCAEAKGDFDKAAQNWRGTGKDIAKRTVHASNYLEGFKLLEDWQLETKQVDAQIKCGALKVFDDWTYDGKRVAFTGANLAEALFGTKTYDNRKKALDIQFGVYFKRFPILLDFARRITAECETGVVRLPSGQYLELLDSPKDNAKAGAAFKGQGGGAAFMQSKMLVAAERYSDHPLMAQIHDDLMWDDIPATWTAGQIKEFVHHLGNEEVDMFPGLIVPFKTKIGPNWGQLTELK